MGELAVDMFSDIAELVQTKAAGQAMRAAYWDEVDDEGHAYNLANLVCLGKKPAGYGPHEGEFFTPEGTRPLAVVNCDNRIVASAARIRWERRFEKWVCEEEQGFLASRPILNNLIDVDASSILVSLKSQKRAIVLFDFRAAFPSFLQDYVLGALAQIGMPECAKHMVKWLYDESKCQLSFRGSIQPGF